MTKILHQGLSNSLVAEWDFRWNLVLRHNRCFIVFYGRLDPTNCITTECRACTLGENLLLTKFKMATNEYWKNKFSAIS